MFVDLLIGLIFGTLALLNGYGPYSVLPFLAAFMLDLDLVVNEFIRIFIKKEKRFSLTTLLDEFSYTHKFIFHLPVLCLPVAFLLGCFVADVLFGFLLMIPMFLHLVHDTVDRNFDGVCWLWPYSKDSFKITKSWAEARWLVVRKTRAHLAAEAKTKKLQRARSTKKIFTDNLI
ncbi:MAG: hypothetical protein COX77_04750 [Candidatus Komeilibacteria bacterium CG_4_10_14_0_2_um_filter_37_10]|uniref:Uncharacterized protein n=1 Tax=Candidatus Komeilibacteria bacterium CG_4_10_14_0_2_um_filter_37_10 TaxID=1974470 RepID=A0A2M7VD59_9BACT|nr:MAG: hypothetical protein COX77_04750 [Candidatus Komeilibacteria bacterium CG_4_10_14_0_2_um_filter_37_10]PJA93969.1 MAG: hypothetical protein CO133_00840 [Candidatus Komeilibacteria bacterium CG_4_9_14_3_um_filter_37_5]